MPRTKGNKNRPKTNIIKDYASQIVEKQEAIASLNTEIASIQKAIEEQKNTLKEKKNEAEAVLKKLLASGMSADEILEKLKEDRPCGQTELQKFTRFF